MVGAVGVVMGDDGKEEEEEEEENEKDMLSRKRMKEKRTKPFDMRSSSNLL